MYIVAGVTGNTGKVVADTLLSQKKPVRVIVRDHEKGEPWKARGAEVAIAELDDAEAVTRALRGATSAYLLLPPIYQSTNVRADNEKRTGSLVRAVEASGVGHVVFLSSIAAQLEDGTGPIITTHDAETALKKTRANLTFVRAAYFMENWGGSLYALAQGVLPTFIQADKTLPMIATDDIGTTSARALIEGGKGHEVIELAGPRDYTPRDVAAALGRVTGKTITLEVGPEEAMVPALTGAGLNAHWAGLFKEMTHAVNVDRLVWEGGAARFVRGPTDIEAVLRKLVSAK
jgi:uncharacterized protein YbjT (DUF2867 family)